MSGEWRVASGKLSGDQKCLVHVYGYIFQQQKEPCIRFEGCTLSDLNENDVVEEKPRLRDRYGLNESYQTPCDDSRLGSGRCPVVAA